MTTDDLERARVLAHYFAEKFGAASEDAACLDRLVKRVEDSEKEIELLLWNLAGCDTYAMGYGLDKGHNKEMARPALESVRKLALRERFASEMICEMEAIVVTLKSKLSEAEKAFSRIKTWDYPAGQGEWMARECAEEALSRLRADGGGRGEENL